MLDFERHMTFTQTEMGSRSAGLTPLARARFTPVNSLVVTELRLPRVIYGS
jgi:hypothetical protein